MVKTIAAAVTVLVLAGQAGSAERELPEGACAAAIDKVASSLVQVEYTLQFDKGEPPASHGFGNYGSMEEYVKEERPHEMGGLLIADDLVLVEDRVLHDRFVKSLDVRCGDQVVPARLHACCTVHDALVLKLDQPIKGATPAVFDAKAKGPYVAVDYEQRDGRWAAVARPMPTSARVKVMRTGETFMPASYGLVVAADGVPVGVVYRSRPAADGSWKGSPLDWPMVPAADLAGLAAEQAARAEQAVLHVRLNFRSPKKTLGRSYRESDDDSATERDVLGLLIGPRRLLVLAQLDAKTTARLERITVRLGRDRTVEAKFVRTLKDFGGLVAELDQSMPGPLSFDRQPIDAHRDRMLLASEVTIKGDERVAYHLRARLMRFEVGWRRRLFPSDRLDAFLFDRAGTLVAFPMSIREKVAVRERWSSSQAGLIPAAYVAEALADLEANGDPNNIPLSEEQENRIAWLGMELQGLDADLARANNCAEQTRNGECGAIVSYVYPESPAARAGVQPGCVLVRLHAPEQPKPLDVRIERDYNYAEQFPWDRLSELPEQYFDRIPRPWPSVANSFNQMLTDLGFGKKFRAEFVQDGKLVVKDFAVEQSPAHFDSAPKHMSKNTGLTVRNLTYEVRRYFRKKADDPGVIVSRIEMGSKASVAGLKPFEIITQVNEKPVRSVEEFGKLLEETKGEVRLNVARMARHRVVKIDLSAPPPKPTTRPDTDDEEVEQLTH